MWVDGPSGLKPELIQDSHSHPVDASTEPVF
jgi:hypothetical protein